MYLCNNDRDVFPNIKLLSLNVRGINGESKRQSIYQYVKSKKVDICFLQETYSSRDTENVWQEEWEGKIMFCHGTSHSRGVMMLFRKGLDITIKESCIDPSGRYIFVKAIMQSCHIQLMNIYAPTKCNEQVTFFKNVSNLLANYNSPSEHLILGGDFNLLMNPDIDRKGGSFSKTTYYDNALKEIEGLIERNNLCDIWRNRYPKLRRYTWRRANPKIHSRLDLWLVSVICQDYCKEVDIIPSIRSDHSAIVLSLEGINAVKGKGYWKLNQSYLEEAEYIKGISDNISIWNTEACVLKDKRSVWEYIKYKIREFSIRYGKQKSQKMKGMEVRYEEKLKHLEEELDKEANENRYNVICEQIKEVEANLKEIDDYKTQGLILRSRSQWYEKGEKSNSYFLGLASRNKVQTTMNKLSVNNEDIVDPQQILQAQADFYSDLYSDSCEKNMEDIQQYLDETDTPIVSELEKENCEGIISSEECVKALKAMKKGKSPGNDGLTSEFYVKFWGLLNNYYIGAINESYLMGELTTSQRQAVITLIDKGDDRTLLKNWRPISLLNTDYKIAAKVIADRLKAVLPGIINPNQVGFVQNRSILDNIRIIADIIHYTQVKDIPGVLLAIDFRKAFDCVSWKFLELTLKKFNFGSSFIRWIKLFYNNISSCVINNGYTSKYFSLHQGVRQGDPLSPYLFTLVVEILACKIRSDNRIKGIEINGISNKLLQYADDTNGIVSDLESAKYFLEVVYIFGEYSNLHLNKDKTQGMWLGKDRNCTKKPLGICWPDGPLKILGVYMSYDRDSCNILNYDKKLVKCKNILNWWKCRNLTMLGRIQIVKTFIISQFLYVTSVIDMPDKYIKEVNVLIRQFVWKSNKSKLRHSIMCKDRDSGGLKLPDFNNMINASLIKWIRRLMINRDGMTWVILKEYLYECNVKNIDVFMEADFNLKLLINSNCLPVFYKNALNLWHKTVQTEGSKKYLIWYNQNILVNKKMIYYGDLYKLGIKYVSDLFDENGKPLQFSLLLEKGIKKCKWLMWSSLINSVIISGLCKHTVEHVSLNTGNFHIGKYDLYKMNAKQIYSHLLVKHYDDKVTVPSIAQFLEINETYEWQVVFNRIYVCTKSSKLQEFQFKFLHNILVNHHYLYKWKLSQSNLCVMCKNEIETLDHMTWECKHIKTFWKDFISFVQNIFHITLAKEDVYLGLENKLLSMITIIAKQYVYNCMRYEVSPSFRICFNKILYIMKIEEIMYRTNGKSHLWLERWKYFLN